MNSVQPTVQEVLVRLNAEREKVRALEARLAEADASIAQLTELSAQAMHAAQKSEALVAEWRGVVDAATAWRSLRMAYEALSAAVQQRFADAGRPSGYSAWTEDERLTHTNLLLQMLSKLKVLEAAIDALSPAAREAAR